MTEPEPLTCSCGRIFASDRAIRSHRSRSAPCALSIDEAFWRKVDWSDLDGCWLWTGSTRGKGYGRLSWQGKSIFATHVALGLSGIELLPGQMACHHCDNPICVRPDHLFVGTNSDNMRDMLAKGRANRTPEYRRRLSEAGKRNWQVPPDVRRQRGDVIAERFTPTIRCGYPLAQSEGGCFRVPGHGDSHRSKAGMLRRRGVRVT